MNTKKNNRCIQLLPLSREHAEGAIFISRIRQGISKTATERLRDYVRWYWKNHIRPHFFQEEKILLPYIPPQHSWAIKLKEDHAYIRDLVLSLDQHADKHSFSALCDLIDEHVRFEERDLFTYMENNLIEEELDAISQKLASHPVDTGEWVDRFWE
jgi:hemerythrin-like domain-containing protein